MIVPVDLNTVDPRGRVDVLAYRGLEWYVKQLEQANNIAGVWDAISPQVNDIVVNTLTDLEIPSGLGIILRVIQANMAPKKVGP